MSRAAAVPVQSVKNRTLGLWLHLDDRGRAAAFCGFAAAVALMGATGSTAARALVGAFALLVFVLVAFSGRDTALVLIVSWLVLLGFVRRLLIPFAGWASNDPLLLLSPAAAVTLWFAGRDAQPPRASALSGLCGFLLLWAVAQGANPNEPSLLVAAQGLMFYVTPLLWFFVGRTLSARQHERVLTTVMCLTAAVAGLGLYQSFVGFLPFELTWLHVSNQGAAVFLPGFKVRPFSTLVSPQEYGIFLSYAAVVIWSRLLRRPSREASGLSWSPRFLGCFLAVTLLALFFQGARGAFLLTLLALTITLVARLRSVIAFLFVSALVAVAGVWVASQDVPRSAVEATAPPDTSPAAAGAVVSHQLSGLTNPSASSATLHVDQAIQGFEDALSNPLGLGVSQATIASVRAEAASVTPENDVGNTMVALGIPGGLALVGVILAGLAAASSRERDAPSWVHLAWLGILVAGLGQWLNGGLYATSTLTFLTLGGLAQRRVTRAGAVT